MVNGKSLVGLTLNEAVDVLKSTHGQKLVQLMVATESTEGDSVAIPEVEPKQDFHLLKTAK